MNEEQRHPLAGLTVSDGCNGSLRAARQELAENAAKLNAAIEAIDCLLGSVGPAGGPARQAVEAVKEPADALNRVPDPAPPPASPAEAAGEKCAGCGVVASEFGNNGGFRSHQANCVKTSGAAPKRIKPTPAATCPKCGMSRPRDWSGVKFGAHKRHCQGHPDPTAGRSGSEASDEAAKQDAAPAAADSAAEGLIEYTEPTRCRECNRASVLVREPGDEAWVCPHCQAESAGSAFAGLGTRAPKLYEAEALGL